MTEEGYHATSPVRVFLVDDSLVALSVLSRMLSASPDIVVAGTARNGKEALEKIPEANPHVICTDLHMPVMNGLQLIRSVMENFPRPILVVSASVGDAPEDSGNVFDLINAGAVDVFPKPEGTLLPGNAQLADELIRKIKVLAGVVVFRRRPTALAAATSATEGAAARPANALQMVGIGASTGGPHALQSLLSQIPSDFPVPIVCVQHISPGFLPSLVGWLSSLSPLPIRIADSETKPEPGVVYFPKEDYHLEALAPDRLSPTDAPPYQGHRPSVTVTFRSLARVFGSSALGVLLTGMGRDGAEGLLSLSAAGSETIVQDEETSAIFGMPKAAIELNAARYVLPLDRIPQMILRLTSESRK
jgi:two-component system chemotaxis response regulator CheB